MARKPKNKLTSSEFVRDAMYRAASKEELSQGATLENLEWDAVQHGFVLRTPVLWKQRRGGAKALNRSRIKGVYTSGIITADLPFNELLPSWNISLNESSQSYRVEIRVGMSTGTWSEWFYLGSAGAMTHDTDSPKILEDRRWGKVHIDYVCVNKPADCFQYRIHLSSTVRGMVSSVFKPPALLRFFAAYSSSLDANVDREKLPLLSQPPLEIAGPGISILYRNQLDVPHRTLGHQICCPTCVAMVLQKFGVEKPTLEVARRVYDQERKIYGIWPRAAQAASHYGMESWVQRFRSIEDVKRLIADGIPVIASIRVQEGELPNARYPKTAGHLILIFALTADGHFVVNDPYSPGPGGSEIVYAAKHMKTVWFDKGGVGIVIRPPQEPQAELEDERQHV